MYSDYKKLCDTIWQMTREFYRTYNIKPNIVNVGHDEFYLLQSGNELVSHITPEEHNHFIFGSEINRVIDDNHLSVGFVIKQEKN